MGVARCQGGSMSWLLNCGNGSDAGLCAAGEMDEGECVGESLPPWSCVGGGSHYRLTVMVTSTDTMKLYSRELDGGQTMGCAKVVWTLYTELHCSFFTHFSLSSYVCIGAILCCHVYFCVWACIQARKHIFANLEGVAGGRGRVRGWGQVLIHCFKP